MKEKFVKKYWEEEDTLFYLHFQDGQAIRQIEITSKGEKFLSLDNPTSDGSALYDQSLESLDLQDSDFITKQDFDKVWNNYKNNNS